MFSYTIDNDLELQLIHPTFAPKIHRLVSAQREYLSQWLLWPPHCTKEEHFSAFIEQSLHDYATQKSMVCSIFYQGEFVGNISFNSVSFSLKKAEIGYWLSQEKQGLGIMSRAVNAMLEIAFVKMELAVVTIAAATENRNSRRVAERLGFHLQGTLPHCENFNGRLVDHAIYSIKRDDWLNASQ
ncbi:GNAT family N-acetyltransferase [Vibrio ulleungensis]|uniref:GNAT family N-acetyltransferase n=1 Tax=Vibrio ulleungensis TaxID=2807619 RepID=A0ABS2HFV1_9VIBR|nr:GNAT family protein [Vibrio ulleungensis]MBM7035541.1 GNAT family N-acetyltransferase [Vibrio ulleungensis]